MNIFLGGVHGVGKSYLAAQVPEGSRLFHVSASTLIKEERSHANWGGNKKVADPAGNQIALANAVRRKNDNGIALLLDGHFVLKGTRGECIYLGVDVFSPLNLEAVILLEASPQIVAKRILERDGREERLEMLEEFIEAERSQAKRVCRTLGIPLSIVNQPTADEFIKLVEPSQ
ncbi:adenylate kinase [Achromobacter deleyi]|uniref:ATP-binding protein n=1 Tax=Achromobacter deleyi TaxID=1353891 RepID=UPI0028675FD6|nr:ATP-binding protein [Achromobacter deleyi]MDR6600223.1 adenylate kinase [Achromobacter deleyi]